MREVDPSTSEQTFVLAALNKGLRTDGRAPYDQRALKLTFGDEPGWVECRLGETKCVYPELILTAGARVGGAQELMVFFFWVHRVVVQVSAEIVKPLADRPYEGFLVLATEISPMASSSYEAGR